MSKMSTTPSVKQTVPDGSDVAVQHLPLPQQVISGAFVAPRYEVWKPGIYKRKSQMFSGVPPTPSLFDEPPSDYAAANLEQIAHRPAFVCGLGSRVDDKRQLVGLTFLEGYELEEHVEAKKLAGDQWRTLWVPYDQIADIKKTLELAQALFPVRSSNVREISDFLTDCYDANLQAPKRAVARRCGYHKVGGKHGWLLRDLWIGPDVHVHPDPAVHDEFANGIARKGSFDAWKAACRAFFDESEFVRWSLGATFAAPLLRFLPERTFFLHHYTETGGGKSTIAQFCMTTLGHPTELKLSLNTATQISLTEIFKHVSDLPILFDELQGKEANLSDFVMQVCQETHRTRARQDGGLLPASAARFRTLIRTTGEQTMTGADRADLGGQAGRALEVRHPGLSLEVATRMWQWNERAETYGHAFPVFLTRLSECVNDASSLRDLQKRFQSFCAHMKQSTGRLGPAERQLAAVAMGEYLMLHWVFDMERKEAILTALNDALTMHANWLRVRDPQTSLLVRGRDFLSQHRLTYPQMYADRTTEEGLNKILRLGTKTSLPLVGIFNAGQAADELWYLPEAVDKILHDKFAAPPDRLWEELATAGILQRGKDRLRKHRQIKGAFNPTSGVYVVTQAALTDVPQMAPAPEPNLYDVDADISDDAEWYEFS